MKVFLLQVLMGNRFILNDHLLPVSSVKEKRLLAKLLSILIIVLDLMLKLVTIVKRVKLLIYYIYLLQDSKVFNKCNLPYNLTLLSLVCTTIMTYPSKSTDLHFTVVIFSMAFICVVGALNEFILNDLNNF